jgi:ribosomal-protein-alanine N-acetyltransferase
VSNIQDESLASPELRTARMVLRLPRESDRAEFVRVYQRSWHLYEPWVPQPPMGQTFEQMFDHTLARSDAGFKEGSGYRFFAFLPNGVLATRVNLFHIVRDAAQRAVISWQVNAELANQGYTCEAVWALLDFAFGPQPAGLGLHRVQADVIPQNAPSIRVAENSGFRREGYAKAYLKIAGKWQDHIIFAKLAEEHLTNVPFR